MNKNLSKLIYLGLLVTFGLVLHLVEQAIPNPFPLPGAKLGLANIITLVALVLYGAKDAMFVAVLRVFLGSLLGGTILGFPFYLSLTGAVLSMAVMAITIPLKNKGILSLVGISLLGAVTHNVAQLFVASLLMEQLGILFLYLPYLLIFAIPTGLFTGLVSTLIIDVIYTNLQHVTRV
ncbi:Gx transporter family protein [Natranaerobius thermophilus]|uniref:Heptaprenyl diphosphate synthase component I n=1 Tax=Natranaerobius thermophilus (strain ATCC BAA-1301 / DSM 18059 / JW/NM-WN-LF) TaxID=457570 RepID=B2A696_NATTJ|nr:Gx transporter family protein [Natranaerobius thermophilus]ACB84107.1 Heptaprenyl diphosphate synthase component I [Natranaerobius thermophilus JW/NM-WN-LF]